MATQKEIEVAAQKFVDRVLKEFDTGGAYIAHDDEVPANVPGGPYERVDIMGWRYHAPEGATLQWQLAVNRIAADAGLIYIPGYITAHGDAAFLRPMHGAMRPVRTAKRCTCAPKKPAKRKTPRRK